MDYAEALISLLEAKVLSQDNPKGLWCDCCCIRHRLCRECFWLKKLVLKDADSGLDLLAEETHTHILFSRKEVSGEGFSSLWWACPPWETWVRGEPLPCMWKKKKKSPGFSVSTIPCRRKVKTTLYFKVPPTHYISKTKNTDSCEAVLCKLEWKWCCISGIEPTPVLPCIIEMSAWLQIKQSSHPKTVVC